MSKLSFINSAMTAKILLLALIATTCQQTMAQEKRVEHNLTVGVGSSKTDNDTDRHGLALSVSYGADIYLSPTWSLMPTVGFRQTSESAIRSGWDGVDFNDFNFVDAGVMARWHSDGNWVIGIGPYVSYVTDRDKYYVDADPGDRLNGKAKLKSYDFGLMPDISYNLSRHFTLGVRAHFSLFDTSEEYSYASHIESRYMHSVEAALTLRF